MFSKEYLEYTVEVLQKLTTTPSVAGNTGTVINWVEKELARWGVAARHTAKNALVATFPGRREDMARTLSGHVDTLGAMVKEIKSNGRLAISFIGGFMGQSVEGEYCLVETADGQFYSGTILTIEPTVHVYDEPGKLERKPKNMEIRLDEVVHSKEDVKKLGIEVGDFVSFDPRTVVTDSGFIKSRHLDDKAGVAILLGVMRYLVDKAPKLPYTTHFLISNYEEVGHGAAHIPANTAEFIAVDMGALGDGQNSDEFSVSICAKDSSGPYDYELRKRLVALAKQHGIQYKLDVYPHYGSDAGAAVRAGWDIKTGLIGPGVDASHAMERTHRDALENTAKLALAYILEG